MVDAQQKIGFNKLGFNGRGTNRQDRLLGEYGRTLWNRPDITGKLEIRQIVKISIGEHIPAAQIGNVFLAEMQLLDILHDLLQTRRDGKTAAIGTPAVKQVKIGDPVFITLFKITVSHGQLIKIAEHGHVQLVIYFQR